MYEWFKDCCPVCGQTSPSSSAPCQTANYTAYKQRQDIVKSKLCYDCTRSRKFMKYQKWRKRKRHQECFGHAPYSNKLVSTSLKTIQCPSWILVLTLTLMLVCCQGNDVRPDPTVIRTELPDVIVPVGKAFYYKIPVSAFQCEVEQLMVTEDSNRFLSHWLAYNSLEHELYGVPSNSDIGTYTILVVAIARGELKRGKICGSKTFVITVPAEGDAKIPIPLMSAALQSAVMGEDGSVQFDNPNMVCRMPCFPGMHTTFASVLVNTDFIQLNGHERILLLQKVAEHLGITSAKLSGFSDQVPHPLISGLESPSLIATGAGDGRFVKGLKTVFTWSLGCGALRVNKTTISHLTTSSQDGTFSRSVGHSIFGWHIMSGVQKSLPKIRVRRAALVGTPTPTTTVAIPTAVSVTSTTMIFNDSMSLSRVFPSVSSTISLTPSVVSSALVAPTLSPKLTASSVEFMATLNLSASEIQTLNATVLSPSTKPKSTADAVTSVRTSATAPLLSPSLLLPTQNVTVVLSPSPTATFQTATFSPTPRINSSVEEVKTTSVAVQSSLRVSPSISESAVGSTSLETRNSSSTAKGQEMSPTLSKVLNQTATLVDSLSQTMELRTVLVTISNQTSLMMTSISAASSVTSATSTSVINDTVASLSIFPSTNMTSTSEMISSFISQPNRTKSLTPSTNQTGSSPTLNVPSSVSASKTSLVVMTTVLSTTNSTQVIPTSSSVVLQRSTRDLVPSSSQTSFTPALNLTSSYNVTRSRPVLTTAINMSVSQNTTNVVKSTPSSVVLQPNKTDMVPGGNKTTMSPVLSQTPQVTMTTATFVIAPTTRIATSSLVGSGIPSTAIPTVLATSPRFSTTTNSTKSQVLSASVSNSTHVSVIGSTVTLSPNMSSGDNESLSVSPALNKTTQIVITESPVSPVLSLSTEIESSEPISAVPTTDVSLKPTTFGVTVSEKSKTTQMESASGVPTLSTISVIGSALLPSESGVLSRTATTELESSPAARISSSRVATRRLNSTALLSSTSRVSLNLSRVVEPATTSHSLIRDSSSTVPLLIVSSLVLMSSVSVTEDLVTSSVATRSFISSSLSDRLESTIAVTAQPSVIIPSSIDAVESSLAVIAVNSSSPVLFANASVTSVSIPSLVSTSQLVSHTVVKISSTERTTRVSSITVALPSPTFTSDVTPSPFSTPLPSTTRTAVVTSKTPIMDTSSLPPTTTLGLSVFKTSATTGSAILSSIFPTAINVSAIFTSTLTVIPTSIGPTLEPSTGPTVPPNNRPERLNDIGRLEAKVGKAFRYVVPRDTFHDPEDGDTRNLSLSCSFLLKGTIPSDYWMQFDSKRQELYGLPLAVDHETYSGKEEYERYILTARDSRGLTARDVFQIVMVSVTDAVTQQLSIRTSNNYSVFTSNVTQRLDLVDRIRTYYGDSDASAIRFVSVTQGSLVVTWTNDTLPNDRCDKEAVQRISSKVISADGEVNQAFRDALEPEFPIQSAREERFGVCNVSQTFPTIPARGQRSASETDMWLKHVLPGVLVAVLLLLLVLMLVVYLRRRRPKPSNPEKVTYRKRKPIVLGEEIELKALPAKPLILPDDDVSCPPSYLSETSLDKAPHYESDEEDEEDFGKRTPSIKYEPPPPFYHTFDSPRNTPPPFYRLPPSYKF